ncbi:MAG: hypothetical protein PHC33_03010 [Candidatus Omnitrophica bacterium]|nr:hypothetical protein [Candidatus Omnitrophota bacterium]
MAIVKLMDKNRVVLFDRGKSRYTAEELVNIDRIVEKEKKKAKVLMFGKEFSRWLMSSRPTSKRTK